MALLKHVEEHHSEEPVEDHGTSNIQNEHTTIPKEIKNRNKKITEEEVEERHQLEELEADLNSLKTEFGLN